MNYYFFPKIENFKASVTLVNYPCLKKFPLRKDPQKIYVTWSDGSCWHYKKIGSIEPYEAKEIHLEDLPIDFSQNIHPFVFFHYEDIPSKTDELVLSDHMFFMPTWRGNIKVYSEYTATSYEGDYQHEMVRFMKKGSVCSLSPMVQKNNNIFNKFIFVNLSTDPKKEDHIVRIVDPRSDTILHEAKATNNSCNIIDLEDIDVPSDTIILAISGTLGGIPAFFSATKDGKEMSFEHTHPPASMVVFGQPLHFQKNLKSFWLSKYAA